MISNMPHWKRLHEGGYFRNHPYYEGGTKSTGIDLEMIRKYIELTSEMAVMIIGAGYGREAAMISPYINWLYLVDLAIVQPGLEKFLIDHGIRNWNFIPFGHGWERKIKEIDFAYSINVMQHITRDIAMNYLRALPQQLNGDGRALIQFCECEGCNGCDAMPAKEKAEPHINWTVGQIRTAAEKSDLLVMQIDTVAADDKRVKCVHHWALLGR